MNFVKLIKAEEEHYISTGLLDDLLHDLTSTVNYVKDMKKAGVKLSTQQQAKIKEAMTIISDKTYEIRNSII